ncbi:MAG: hypothetical protein U9R48_00745 [Chloroflexota bacterium]|nr:hypothetical protein [Chloroflexota bacterium]
MTSVAESGPNVSWLDEELRKEKATVTELQEIIDEQQVALNDQARRITMLEDRLAKLQGQLLRIPDVEEALQHTRGELVSLMSDLRQEQKKRHAEFLSNRQAEREQEIRVLQEIRQELERFDPLEESLSARKAEEQKLREFALRLQEEVEDVTGSLSGEEARRTLEDSISKNRMGLEKITGRQEELAEVQGKLLPRLSLLEDALSRLQQQVSDLQNVRQDLTEQQEAWLERQRRTNHANTQRLTEWERELEGYEHQVEVWADQLRHFTDQYEKNRQFLREIQELAQNVSQQQDQLRQLQRIFEDQLRREFREWKSENDRRWVRETEHREKTAQERTARENAQGRRLSELEMWQEEAINHLVSLDGRLDQLREDLVADTQEMKQARRQAWQKLARSMQELVEEASASFGVEGD